MKGFTEKDGVLVIIFANNLIYKWQKFQPSQTSPSVFPLEIAYLVQKLWNFWYQVKILVFLHHLQKEWVLFYLKWAWNECLHLRTSEMSIDMGRRIVHCANLLVQRTLSSHFVLDGLPTGYPGIGHLLMVIVFAFIFSYLCFDLQFFV